MKIKNPKTPINLAVKQVELEGSNASPPQNRSSLSYCKQNFSTNSFLIKTKLLC